LTNLQAALGVAQIERMDEIISKKRWIGESYSKQLDEILHLQLPVEKSWAKHVFWMYGIVLDEKCGMNGTEFAQKLAILGVQTRPFFLGMHEQPVFLNRRLYLGENYPVAEKIARQGLYLPSGLALTDEQLNKVCYSVSSVLRI